MYQVLPLLNRDKLDDPDDSFILWVDVDPEPLARPVPKRAPQMVSQLDHVKDDEGKPKKRKDPNRRLHGPTQKLIAPLARAPDLARGDSDRVALVEVPSSESDSDLDDGDGDEPPDRPADGGGGGGCGIIDKGGFEDLSDAPPSVLAALFGKRSAGDNAEGGPSAGAACSSSDPGLPSGVALAAGGGDAAEAAAEAPGPAVDAGWMARGKNVVRFEVGDGYILKNDAACSMDAHCEVCKLAVNRKWTAFKRARTPKTRAQGRPFGLCLALLKAGCPGEEGEHRALIATLTHAVRLSARQSEQHADGAQPFFALERDENEDDIQGEPRERP
jgi:hypothetical protein